MAVRAGVDGAGPGNQEADDASKEVGHGIHCSRKIDEHLSTDQTRMDESVRSNSYGLLPQGTMNDLA